MYVGRGHEFDLHHAQHTKQLINSKDATQNATTKNWVTYGKSHPACD